jgi:multidrug efflux system outer membrane protein
MNRPRFKEFLLACAGAGLSAVLATGCAVGPNYRAPATKAPERFVHAPTNTLVTPPAEWWNSFHDPLLTRLLTQAATNNYEFRLAQARLREVRALWREARFDYVPTVRSENRFEKTQTAEDTAGDRSRKMELYRVGFDATWELDLWGRVRRSVEAARATVESIEASRDDVFVAVQAEIAANYLELRGAQGLLGVATRNATNQAQTLRLAVALRDGGQATQLDVARARSLLYATMSSIPPLEADAERAAHRIAVLCGRPPAALRGELSQPIPPFELPTELSLANPTEVLRRRPDIRAAERSLAAAVARIGVEVADLFPAVTFVGTIGLEGRTLSNLANTGAGTYGFGPHLSWAAFDLGRVRQRIKAADARAEGALATYEQTVLLALEETENSLVTLSRERHRLAYLVEAELAAAEATDLARQRYRDGIADFLSVLDAERTLLSLQEQMVSSRTRAGTSLVAVYKALAGGLR